MNTLNQIERNRIHAVMRRIDEIHAISSESRAFGEGQHWHIVTLNEIIASLIRLQSLFLIPQSTYQKISFEGITMQFYNNSNQIPTEFIDQSSQFFWFLVIVQMKPSFAVPSHEP